MKKILAALLVLSISAINAVPVVAGTKVEKASVEAGPL